MAPRRNRYGHALMLVTITAAGLASALIDATLGWESLALELMQRLAQ
jgi:hypothetical protein